MLRFDSQMLKEKMVDVLSTEGLNDVSIKHLTDSMISTSLRGTDSHGINLFPHYINAIRSGRISKKPAFNFAKGSNTTVILDADHAIGHHSSYVAMEYAVGLAKEHGMGSVAIKNSTHCGAVAYFGLLAAEQDCIGFAFTNADDLVKASNGRDSFFGTNPICFTAPLLDEAPLCHDMATSLVSWNKIRNHCMEDRAIPDHWAFNKNGDNVTNPHDARSLAPIGDYKGFGLGMMVDVLTSLLSNSPISKDIKPMFTSEISEKRFIGQYVMVIDISKYIDIQLFKQSLQSMVDRIRVVEPLDNNPVMVPGDPEKLSTVERIQNGIPIDEFRYKEYLEISNLFSNCLIND
ncbi:MAG: hypothetical protein CL661_09035 [Bacteroidetes bacterium]|nr:hypothetical protein [Bacteroidota bacterium]